MSPSEPPQPGAGPPAHAAGGVTSEPTAVDLRDYVDFSLAGVRGRRVFATDAVAVDLVCLEPSQAVEPRTFVIADAIYTVVGGRAWVVTDEAEVTLEPLQSVCVPAGVPHALRNDSPDPLILHVVISPPDQLPEVVAGPAVDEPVRPGVQPGRSAVERLRRALGGG